MVRVFSVLCLCLVVALPARASTVSVAFSGTVFRVTGPQSFLDVSPIAVGDTLNLTATLFANPTSSVSGATAFYLDPYMSLSGQIGSYSFAMTTTPDAFRPIPVQRLSIADNSSGVDRVQASSSVSGASVGPYQATLFGVDLRDDTQSTISSLSYDPMLFDQSYIDVLKALPLDGNGRLQFDAQAQLDFRTTDRRAPGGRVFIDLKATPVVAAPVPLPASALLLVTGVGVIALRGRRRAPLG